MRDRDHAIIAACLAGDRKAWKTLILRYERLLHAIPLRCGLSEDDAVDVAQTVCVRLIQNLEKIRDEGHLAAWLVQTTKRESWHVYRMRQRQVDISSPGSDPSGPGVDVVDESPSPHDSMMRLEEEDMVQAGLQQMDDRCRRLLEMLYQTDPVPSYDEIAGGMAMPRGAIGPTRARCLKKLQKILEDLGF